MVYFFQYKEISFDQFEAQETDSSGTQAAEDRLRQLKLDSAEGGGTGDGAPSVDVPIDENLFEDSDIPDTDDECDGDS